MSITLTPDLAKIYAALVRAADTGATCPGNLVLAELIGKESTSGVSDRLQRLEAHGLIHVERGNNCRVVTIIASGRRTAGDVSAPHWRHRALGAGLVAARPRQFRPVPRVSAPDDRVADLAARIEADQAERRRQREHWLEIEQQRYRLPRRGRLLEEMPA